MEAGVGDYRIDFDGFLDILGRKRQEIFEDTKREA